MKQKTSKQRIYDLILAALCMALGIVLPFFTGQIPQIGGMLLPMHLPVLLCGLLCGWQYGGLVGFVLPLLRYAMFGMPPIFPTGIAMAFELAAYGIIAGYLYNHSRWQCVISLYRSLIAAMIGGRIVWGVVRVLLTGVGEVYPFMRVHHLLEALQPHFADMPILVMYPGTFDGRQLRLFDRLPPSDYYRAFNAI